MVLTELRAVDVVDMTPATVAAHAGLSAAWELLESSGCQFVPVVRDDKVVGVIEEGALVAATATGGLRRPVRDDASSPTAFVVVPATTPLAEVVAAVRRTPTDLTLVVDDQGRLVGAISTERLITLLDGAMETP